MKSSKMKFYNKIIALKYASSFNKKLLDKSNNKKKWK